MKELTQPPYLPFLTHPDVVHMGLAPLALECWIEPDSEFISYYENKKKLFTDCPEQVYLELPESLAAQKEFAERLSAHLLQDHGGDYTAQRSLQNQPVMQLKEHKLTFPIAVDERSLWNAGLWIQDDVCLLQEQAGRYHLTAATLCSPSGWRLQDKIGRPMFDIHAPVPGLNKTIGPQIDHVLSKLSPLRPFKRFNWSVKDTAQLALSPGADWQCTKADAAEQSGFYLRVERQTLTRLPTTQAIAFTIRVYLTPFAKLAKIPGTLVGLESAIRAMSADEARYKALAGIYPRLQRTFKHYRAG